MNKYKQTLRLLLVQSAIVFHYLINVCELAFQHLFILSLNIPVHCLY